MAVFGFVVLEACFFEPFVCGRDVLFWNVPDVVFAADSPVRDDEEVACGLVFPYVGDFGKLDNGVGVVSGDCEVTGVSFPVFDGIGCVHRRLLYWKGFNCLGFVWDNRLRVWRVNMDL